MAIFKLDVLGLLLQCKSPQGIYSKLKKKIFKKEFLFSAYGFFNFFFVLGTAHLCSITSPKQYQKGPVIASLKFTL